MYSKEGKSYTNDEREKGLKPDALAHKKCNEGTMAKQATLPGQMYVPKKTLPVDLFAGDVIMGKK